MKTEKKPEFEPWNKKELAIMQLSLGQEEQKRLKALAEIRRINEGLTNYNKEIKTNISSVEMKVKAATMELNDLKFDEKNNITLQRLQNRVMELESDNERTEVNVRNFKLQIKEGKPKVIDMEEPTIEPTPEEKATKHSAEKEAVEDTAADSRNDDQETDESAKKDDEGDSPSDSETQTGE